MKLSGDAVWYCVKFLYSNIFAQVISGIQLPPSIYSSSNKADTLVIIEIFGVPNDQVKQHTRVVKKNGELLIYFIELLLDFLLKSLKIIYCQFWYLTFIRQRFCIMFKMMEVLYAAKAI